MEQTTDNKTYQANIKYFTRWQGMRTLGAALAFGGIGAFAAGWIIRIYILFILSIPVFVTGLAIYIFACVGTSTEAHILAEIEERKAGIAFPELMDEKRFVRRTPKQPEVYEFENFCYDDTTYLQRLSSGVMCTAEYSRTVMHLLTDAFYIKTLRFSLVSDKESLEIYDIPFTAVEDIAVEHREKELPFKKQILVIKEHRYIITYDGGKTLAIVAKNDAYAEDLAEKLKKTVRKATAHISD